jgi:N-methylhydantoinase A/oxoprolinase/acetone carboxylase beta subunit
VVQSLTRASLPPSLSRHDLRLGIDTGGTYTDAVLVNNADHVVAGVKALTTHSDLAVGIRAALARLPQSELDSVVLVSLSTTLATNAVVEGRGAPVGLILAGYSSAQAERAHIEQIVPDSYLLLLDGSHDATGSESAPLDLDTARTAVFKWNRKISAIGVSAIFGVRNPAHEIMLREMIRAHTNLPVTCGHELSSSLDAPRRAVTVAINASLIPFISKLIRSVQEILGNLRVDAPLMVVKGDGSLVRAEIALQRPVETVISGPAASVIGACHLSQSRTAIIADMGGTTTDIAIVTNGQPDISDQAALIGDWRPMVETIRVLSVGLGGDSEARFKGGRGLALGPRRVVPMSLLGHEYPTVLADLEAQLSAPPTLRSNRFALQLHVDQSQLTQMSKLEREVWQRLAEGPLEMETLSQENRQQAKAVAALVRKGIAIYSGFTPSDAAHVLQHADHWSKNSAELAAKIWAKQMRHVYGWGTFQPGDAQAPSRVVHDMVIRQIMNNLVSACLSVGGNDGRPTDLRRISEILTSWLTTERSVEPKLLSVHFQEDRKLIAVGAPAHLYYPVVSGNLGLNLEIPVHADVANAVGAVVASVTQREHMSITQPTLGLFRAHDDQGPADFTQLKDAIQFAESATATRARSNAHSAGAATIELVTKRMQTSVEPDDLSAEVFFECRVTSTASGRPSVSKSPAEDPPVMPPQEN